MEFTLRSSRGCGGECGDRHAEASAKVLASPFAERSTLPLERMAPQMLILGFMET